MSHAAKSLLSDRERELAERRREERRLQRRRGFAITLEHAWLFFLGMAFAVWLRLLAAGLARPFDPLWEKLLAVLVSLLLLGMWALGAMVPGAALMCWGQTLRTRTEAALARFYREQEPGGPSEEEVLRRVRAGEYDEGPCARRLPDAD